MLTGFRLKPGRDDDIINWLAAIPEGDRGYYIRETLRKGIAAAGPSRPPAISPATELPPVPVLSRPPASMDPDQLQKNLDSW